MSLILMETYCTGCSFSYVDKEDVPEDEEVIQIWCDCGKITILHKCKSDGKYREMKIRDVHAHEIDDRKKLKSRTRTHAKTVQRKVE